MPMLMRMGYTKCIICGCELGNDEQTYCESCEDQLGYNECEEEEEDDVD